MGIFLSFYNRFLQITPSMFFSYNSAYGIAIFSFFFLQRGFKNGRWIYIFFAGLTSGLAFIFKQNVGGFIALSFYILLVLLPEIKNRKKLIFSYSLGFISIVSSMFFYFWINDALRQLIQSTLFFAQEFKSANTPFIIHRLFFIPLFLLVFISFKYLNKRIKFLFLAIMPFFVLLYILLDLSRIGRLIDYLQDNVFYVQTFLYITPLIVISRYINKIKRTQIDNDCLMYSVLLLAIFFMNTFEGYSSGIITLANIFLIPVVILLLEKFSIRRVIVIAIIILMSFPFLYNPLKSYALHVGNYPLNTITEYSSIPAAKYIKFNPEEKKEILQIISNINKHTEKDERILCFPYCPMIYILSDRQGATYYGIFGLTYDQKLIISQIIEDHPKIIIVIKQGNFILSPSLETSNLKRIYEYIRKNYQKISETNNFIVYGIIN